MIYNLQNIIPLGVLDYGIYPNKDRRPIIYLYYRPNGDLMMYRTKDEIEVNLTNSSSYDTNILFRVTDKDSIFDNDITCFESRPIDVDKATYKFEYVKDKSGYIYILVPAIYNTHSIFINNEDATDLFSFEGVYEHVIEHIRDKEYRYYYVYRTTNKRGITDDLTVTLLINRITENEVSLIVKHINDFNDPHHTIDKILSMNLFSAINWQELPGNPTVINLDIIRGTEEQINNVPLRDKQFLFDTTNRIFYVDSATERIPYGNYKEIDTTGFIRSSQITRIEFVDSGYVPQQDDFILYLEIPGYPTITVDIHNLSIPNTGGTYTVNVSSNTFWTVFGGVYNTSSGNYELYWSSKKSTILIKPSKTPIQKGSSYYIEGDCRMDIVIDKNDTTNSYSNVISFITEYYGVKANVDLTQEAGEEPEPEYYLYINLTTIDVTDSAKSIVVSTNTSFEIVDSYKEGDYYYINWGSSNTDRIRLYPSKPVLEGSTTFTIDSNPNTEENDRSKTIRFRTIVDDSIYRTLKVNQYYEASTLYLNVQPKSLNYTSDGSTQSVNVSSNTDWTILNSIFESPNKFTINQTSTGNKITIISNVNPVNSEGKYYINGDAKLQVTVPATENNSDTVTNVEIKSKDNTLTDNFGINQSGKTIEYYIRATPTHIELTDTNNRTITISSNASWKISDIYDFVKQDDGTYKYDLDAVEGASLIITPSKEDLSGNMTLQIKSTVKSSGLNATSLDLTFELINDSSKKAVVDVSFNMEDEPEPPMLDGIDYMQIEGDGIKHPIFRVAGKTIEYLNVQPKSLNYTSDGSTQSVNVSSNTDWTILNSIFESPNKFTINQTSTGNKITIISNVNPVNSEGKYYINGDAKLQVTVPATENNSDTVTNVEIKSKDNTLTDNFGINQSGKTIEYYIRATPTHIELTDTNNRTITISSNASWKISDIYDFVKQDDGTYKYDLDAVEGASLIITPSKEDLSGNMTLQIKSTVKSSGLNATSLDLTFELINDSSKKAVVDVSFNMEDEPEPPMLDGIDYMQIEGDGIEHPIFRVAD